MYYIHTRYIDIYILFFCVSASLSVSSISPTRRHAIRVCCYHSGLPHTNFLLFRAPHLSSSSCLFSFPSCSSFVDPLPSCPTATAVNIYTF